MTADDVRTEAEALRLQMMIGLGQPADVITWADRMIAAEETPHISIIELALAGDESMIRLVSRLNDIPGEARMSDARNTTRISRRIRSVEPGSIRSRAP